jgi:hypothetical protein
MRFTNPTFDTLLRITEAIEIDLGDILTRAQEEISKAAKSIHGYWIQLVMVV